MSRRKSPYTNTTTDDVFANVAAHMRSASDSKVQRGQEDVNENEDEEEESEEEQLVSQTMAHTIPSRIGSYEIRGTVGEGAFSVVRLAFSPQQKQYYACKVIERSRLKHNDLENRFKCEIRVHQQMHHPGIVQLIDILEDEYFYYVFVEFCPGGELFQHIVDSGRLQEEQAKPIMRQILEAVNYIHMMGVSHRDLKPENLLLDQFGHTKISDFGLSRFLDMNGLAVTPCGSPCYASPECISGAPYDGRTSDCWSVGVILYAIVTGQLPWTKRNQNQLFEQIRRGEYTVPGYISGTCRNFINSLMCVDYKKRLTALQALDHPFLSGVTVPLGNMLTANQNYSFVSLKKVDTFFGEKNEQIEAAQVADNQRHNSIRSTDIILDFEKALKEIVSINPVNLRPRKSNVPVPVGGAQQRIREKQTPSANSKISTQNQRTNRTAAHTSTKIGGTINAPKPHVKGRTMQAASSQKVKAVPRK